MISPNCPRHRGPRVPKSQYTSDIVSDELLENHVVSCPKEMNTQSNLSGDGIQNNSVNPKEGHSRRTGLRLYRAWERGDDDGTRLGLPERIDDGTLLPSYVFVVPVPSLGVDRFTDTAKDAEAGEVVWLYVLRAETAEKADGGGSRVELGQFVLFDGLPVARGGGVDRSRFEDGGGDAVKEGPVDDEAEWWNDENGV